MVAISYLLSAIYWNSNESSGCTSVCNRTLLKIHNFDWSHASTKDANVVAISKLLRATT